MSPDASHADFTKIGIDFIHVKVQNVPAIIRIVGRMMGEEVHMDQEQAVQEVPDVLDLLDEIGLDFALHTHHPLTHLEVDDLEASAKERRMGPC